MVVHACMLSHVQLFATPWTVACPAPLSMGFPRQEYCSGLPFPSLGLLDPEIEPTSPALAGRFFTTEPPGKPLEEYYPQIRTTGINRHPQNCLLLYYASFLKLKPMCFLLLLQDLAYQYPEPVPVPPSQDLAGHPILPTWDDRNENTSHTR